MTENRTNNRKCQHKKSHRKNLDNRNKNRIRSLSEVSHRTSHRSLTVVTNIAEALRCDCHPCSKLWQRAFFFFMTMYSILVRMHKHNLFVYESQVIKEIAGQRKQINKFCHLNPFTTSGTICPKNLFETTIGKNVRINSTALYPNGIATHCASCHAIKRHVIALFSECWRV